MTSSGATGRPGTDQDARNKSAPPADRQDQQSNGAKPGPPSNNGSPNGQQGGADPAVENRRQQGGGQPRGAAAARVATRNRSREDTTPRTGGDSTQNPWARPGDQPAQNGAPNAAASPNGPAPPPAPSGQAAGASPHQGPVPPPSLVAQQGGAAPSAFPAAAPGTQPGPVPAAPVPPSNLAVDTQASLEAVPPAPRPSAPAKASATPSPSRSTSSRRPGRVRKARLRLLRVDPWSVMKTAFLLSVALGITLFVAVAVLWSVLDAAGVFSSIDDVVTDMTASDSNSGIDINQYVELSRVLGFTTLIAVVDVVLLTALATLGAFLYNLSASLLGGLELTLAEDD
ncbi:DUF3566 domain-containing protein [Jiangella aurantiaca]|uniref:DUF3566 domain-containing protein n=1 Tax=Jiangella aurantiaca TaxID=2530373 RepID=UPI00193CA06B|nr:DUF3566 domain-containing protein [Jiangella aurantiaca]